MVWPWHSHLTTILQNIGGICWVLAFGSWLICPLSPWTRRTVRLLLPVYWGLECRARVGALGARMKPQSDCRWAARRINSGGRQLRSKILPLDQFELEVAVVATRRSVGRIARHLLC